MSKYLLLLFAILIASCSAMKMPCPCQAEETITVEGKVLKMDTEIWVDKMPTMDPVINKNTHINVQLYTEDNSSLPEEIKVELYVLKPSDDSYEGYEGTFTEVVKDEAGGIIVLKNTCHR
jgi:hypothetical protein